MTTDEDPAPNPDNHAMAGPDKDIASGRIEGGIDAIVLGANAEGLAAATYLAKKKLNTVLIDGSANVGGIIQQRAFGDGFSAVDGDSLITHLDPQIVDDLDLYRFGLEFTARRLNSTYFFDDGSTLAVDGDFAAASALLDVSDADKSAFQAMAANLLEKGGLLRELREDCLDGDMGGSGDQPSTSLLTNESERALSVSRFLGGKFDDERLASVFEAETALIGAPSLYTAFSVWDLFDVASGEAAGLLGARAYPKGGSLAVIDALRRAAQEAGVTIRLSAPPKAISIEADRVAGVELERGGQLRAPIVISALDSHTTFQDLIGPAKLDVGFQQQIRMPPLKVTTAQYHIVLKGVPSDEATAALMQRRLVYAPGRRALEEAYIDAKEGRVSSQFAAEIIFPDAFGGDDGERRKPRLLVTVFPIAFDKAPHPKFREQVEAAIIEMLDQLIPGIEKMCDARDLRLLTDLAEPTGISAQVLGVSETKIENLARMIKFAEAGNINGLFYCGEEMKVGRGVCLVAARIAARRAYRYFRKGSDRP